MDNLTLKAENRNTKVKAKDLRAKGIIPAVISNHGKTESVQVSSGEVHKLFTSGISESTLIDLKLGSESETVFIKDYQLHPVTDEILHVDFYRITAGEKIKTNIPLHLVGKAVGIKEGGVLEHFLHDIEIETFPRFLVPSIDVDISALKIGDAIHIKDLKLNEEIKILVEGNPTICHVSPPAKLEVETEEADKPEAAAGEEARDSEEEGKE